MRITSVVAMVAMAGANLWARQSVAAPQATVTVCIDSDPIIPGGTRALVSTMFARIGVRIDWRERPCPVEVGAIAVSLPYYTPDNQVPGALAFARPYEGTIVVFTDRVRERQELNSDRFPTLWAHVLVHEITHILQGICRHSATGIMKDRWDREDYFAMSRKPLPFAQEDIDLIHQGLRARQARMVAGPPAAVNPAAVAVQ